MKSLTIVVGAVILSVVSAAAQTTRQQQPSPSPCQAEPDQNRNTGNDNGKPGEQKPPPGDLTQTLGPCNGVLKPPPTGDTDLTTPAPNQGNTPIIKPGDLPPQPPKK